MRVINVSSVHLDSETLFRQFPNGAPEWNGWKFVFNAEREEYDYLVVFDDIHAPVAPKCSRLNTIHVATEPPSVHRYDENYLSQFAWVITQDEQVIHPKAVYHQPGLDWFIGLNKITGDQSKALNYPELKALFDLPKTKLISVISSNKTFTWGHVARLRFAKKLKAYYGDSIDFYGRGFTPMDDKLDALRDYRFHVVIENSSYDHYFTEKLTDCILAGTYPIYHGCPNLGEYYPENSYARIDIADFENAVKVIDSAITQEFDLKHREALLSARDLTLEKYNKFPTIINLIEKIEAGEFGEAVGPKALEAEMLPFYHPKFQQSHATGTPVKERLYKFVNRHFLLGPIRPFV